jgi:hypothetical protein
VASVYRWRWVPKAVESVLALMPCERSVVLPEGVASGVLNGGDVGGVLDRGGVGSNVMALTRSWETDRDLIGEGGGIRAVWRREVIRPTRGQLGTLQHFLTSLQHLQTFQQHNQS